MTARSALWPAWAGKWLSGADPDSLPKRRERRFYLNDGFSRSHNTASAAPDSSEALSANC